MKRIFAVEEMRELLLHITAIAELVHQNGVKVAKDMNLPDEFISYMKSKTLSAPEDLECDYHECNPEGVEIL